MNSNNLKIYLQAQAIATRVKGMEATNMSKVQEGNMPMYTEKDFESMALALVSLTRRIQDD
jgi:hypothetical protein